MTFGQTLASAQGHVADDDRRGVDVSVLVDGRLDAVEPPERTGWWPGVSFVSGPQARRRPETGPRPSARADDFTPESTRNCVIIVFGGHRANIIPHRARKTEHVLGIYLGLFSPRARDSRLERAGQYLFQGQV